MITVGIDTYTTVAEADTYFASTLKDAIWTALGTPVKEICLKTACRKMETLPYTGVKTISTQLLEFPRCYTNSLYNSDYIFNPSADGTPQDIKNAQSELALWLYQNQNNQALNAQEIGIKSMSLGGESYSFEGTAGNILCVDCNDYLNKWIRKGFKVG